MTKTKYTVYRGGSLESDKIITSDKLVIPGESSITSYIPADYADLSDMELMSRLMTGEDAENLQEESAKRTRKKEYEKYSDKIGDIYIAKWKKAGLSNTGTLQLLGNPEFVNIRKLVNGTEDMKTIQKKLQDLYKSLDKSIYDNELKAYIGSCKEGYGQMWEKTVGLVEKDIKDIFTTLTKSGGKINDVLKQFDNNEINFTEAKKSIGSLFNTLHESIMEEDDERKKKDVKKSITQLKENLKESNKTKKEDESIVKEEIPVIISSKKKKSKSKTKATAEEVAEAEEAYKRTEELSRQEEKEGNIRLKELRSLDEEKEAEEEEKQKKYEGSQHIKTFDKLFTEIFKSISSTPSIKISGGKGYLFENIMTKTNMPKQISKQENKELNQSIKHIMSIATGITQTEIPVLSSNFLPPNCSNYSDGIPYDLLDQYKNFIELKYYNTYMFGYKVKNGRLYESASGVNIEVKSVQFQMSKFVRDNLDDFKIFYTREGPNNYKIHNVYIKKDNNNKTINKPTNTEYNKNLTVIMAFEKSFYYFNPLELLTDDIMDLASTSDTKTYKITSNVYIPNFTKLNFFINESLISIGDDGLARNDTRIPFSYFKRI